MKKLFTILLLLPLFVFGQRSNVRFGQGACSNPAAITGTLSACAGSTSQLTNTTAGGTWSSSSTTVATIGTSGIVTGVAAGTANISYSISSVCYVAATFTVNALPAAITGTLTCTTSTTSQLSNATAGGTWSSSTTTVATIGTAGLVTGVGVGTTTISYTLSTGCRTTAVVTVTSGGFTPSTPTARFNFSNNATITQLGGAISAIADEYGSGNTISQATGTKQPLLSGSGRTANALFDGINDALTGGFTLGVTFTIYIRFKTVTNVVNANIFDGFGSRSGGVQQDTYPNIYAGNAGPASVSPLTTGTYQTLAVAYNGGATAICNSGSFQTFGGSSTGITSPNGITIASSGGIPQFPSNIAVQDVWIYNGVAHSTSTITSYITYIATLW